MSEGRSQLQDTEALLSAFSYYPPPGACLWERPPNVTQDQKKKAQTVNISASVVFGQFSKQDCRLHSSAVMHA